MSAVFEYPLRVRPAEVDRVGHVHNLEYLRWMQDAAVAHSAAYGWPTAVYYELGQGWVVRSHTIEYLAAAFVDDELIVRTWIANMKRVSSYGGTKSFARVMKSNSSRRKQIGPS